MKLAKRLVEQQKRGLMMSVQHFVDRHNVENQENQHFPSRHHFVPPCQVEKTFEHHYVQHMVSESSEPLVIDFSVLKSMDINVKGMGVFSILMLNKKKNHNNWVFFLHFQKIFTIQGTKLLIQ